MKETHKYEELWRNLLPEILKKVKQAIIENKTMMIALNQDKFKELGERENSGHGFRMDITNGIIPIKSGSSVARDLKRVLENSSEFMELITDNNLTIRMGKDFILEIIP
ncbi:MAG: hypothetical protein HDR88_16895 [Bacteroides sp.]|nr:hypothetical protein [Bacteroides sp.]